MPFYGLVHTGTMSSSNLAKVICREFLVLSILKQENLMVSSFYCTHQNPSSLSLLLCPILQKKRRKEVLKSLTALTVLVILVLPNLAVTQIAWHLISLSHCKMFIKMRHHCFQKKKKSGRWGGMLWGCLVKQKKKSCRINSIFESDFPGIYAKFDDVALFGEDFWWWAKKLPTVQ